MPFVIMMVLIIIVLIMVVTAVTGDLSLYQPHPTIVLMAILELTPIQGFPSTTIVLL